MKKSGMTLLELLIASGLALVISSLLFTLIYTTSVASVRSQAQVEIQESAIVALNRVASDLMQCTPAGVGVLYDSTPPVDLVLLCLHRVVDVTTTNPPGQIFDQQLISYWWAPDQGQDYHRGRLFRRQIPNGTTPTLTLMSLPNPLDTTYANRCPSQADLRTIVSDNGQSCDSLAHGVTSFQIVCGTNLANPVPTGPPQPYKALDIPPSITNPLTIFIAMEKECKGGVKVSTRGNPCETFQVTRTVFLRDGN